LPIYEGMFLLDSGRAAKDWAGTESLVTQVLERYGAKFVLKDRWDERKLAFAIKKQKRGTYYLAYFDAPAGSLAEIRRDLTLTDGVLRFLLLAWPEGVALPDKIEVRRTVPDEDFRTGREDGEGGGERRRREEPEEEPVAAAEGRA
jgi:small subunit ribosomal protein S6